MLTLLEQPARVLQAVRTFSSLNEKLHNISRFSQNATFCRDQGLLPELGTAVNIQLLYNIALLLL